MILDSLSYLVSAFFVFLIRRPEPPVAPHDEEAHGPKPSMRQEIAVGLRYVTGHRWLRAIAATTGTSNFFGNVMGAILILYVSRERGLAPGGDRVRVLDRVHRRPARGAGHEPDHRARGRRPDAGADVDRVQPVGPAGRDRRRTT